MPKSLPAWAKESFSDLENTEARIDCSEQPACQVRDTSSNRKAFDLHLKLDYKEKAKINVKYRRYNLYDHRDKRDSHSLQKSFC